MKSLILATALVLMAVPAMAQTPTRYNFVIPSEDVPLFDKAVAEYNALHKTAWTPAQVLRILLEEAIDSLLVGEPLNSSRRTMAETGQQQADDFDIQIAP